MNARRVTTMLALAAVAAAPRELPAQEANRTWAVPHVLETLGRAIDEPMPAGLSPANRQLWVDQTTWLQGMKVRIQGLGASILTVPPRDRATGQSTGRRQHSPVRFQKEYDAVKKDAVDTGQPFGGSSGPVRARHDIAMNAIRNMKG